MYQMVGQQMSSGLQALWLRILGRDLRQLSIDLGSPSSAKMPSRYRTSRRNQGFVVAFDIRHATDLIEANPIGFPLLTEQEK